MIAKIFKDPLRDQPLTPRYYNGILRDTNISHSNLAEMRHTNTETIR
jgi:hypothetical protein